MYVYGEYVCLRVSISNFLLLLVYEGPQIRNLSQVLNFSLFYFSVYRDCLINNLRWQTCQTLCNPMAKHFGWNYIHEKLCEKSKLAYHRERYIQMICRKVHVCMLARSIYRPTASFALVRCCWRCCFFFAYLAGDLLTMLRDLFNKLISFALNCRL